MLVPWRRVKQLSDGNPRPSRHVLLGFFISLPAPVVVSVGVGSQQKSLTALEALHNGPRLVYRVFLFRPLTEFCFFLQPSNRRLTCFSLRRRAGEIVCVFLLHVHHDGRSRLCQAFFLPGFSYRVFGSSFTTPPPPRRRWRVSTLSTSIHTVVSDLENSRRRRRRRCCFRRSLTELLFGQLGLCLFELWPRVPRCRRRLGPSVFVFSLVRSTDGMLAMPGMHGGCSRVERGALVSGGSRFRCAWLRYRRRQAGSARSLVGIDVIFSLEPVRERLIKAASFCNATFSSFRFPALLRLASVPTTASRICAFIGRH